MSMNGKGALDSNAVVNVLNNRLDLSRIGIIEAFVPIVAIGELLYGVHKSARASENRARLPRLHGYLEDVVVLGCSMETADVYGKIKLALRRAGTPIPDNDMWIAATALEHGLPIVTNDKHFTYIEGLEIVRY
jgi:tRNA(fMet)-specific endonuclease VapC